MGFKMNGLEKYEFLEKDGMIVPIKKGLSWLTFIFGPIALLFRGQVLIALLAFLLLTGISELQMYMHIGNQNNLALFLGLLINFFLAFNANEWKKQKYLRNGFKIIDNPFNR